MLGIYFILLQTEASRVLNEAQALFSGPAEVARLKVAQADLALASGDLDTALAQLRSIPPGHPYFLMARQQMARIYLEQRYEPKLFIACYRDMADKLGTREAYELLGDAYLRIQEPERAIEIYESLLCSPGTSQSTATAATEMSSAPIKPNGRLTLKLGRALVQAHLYERAIAYYQDALPRDPRITTTSSGTMETVLSADKAMPNANRLNRPSTSTTMVAGPLLQDLAELLINLRKYDLAKSLLMESLEFLEPSRE
ncbi:unnamed protein product [Protopolystoma xenopodis]|uniref:Tetratricopeptide repeat protein n=1 Tax=Protopolystoma xenopodis TaxID=117903 RepID=A0A448WND8_9PLAT|nr:unnamed protein product [Protopolystoma xenopodis]